MPFGFKNAPAKFQRVMDAELQDSGCSAFAFAYIDDLLIASDTWEEHVEHVDKVLRMLKGCNLMIHPDKSVFGTNIVEYLGHNVVGSHGITMNEAKVEAIKALPVPTNVSELRSILGFLSYYRHFIPGFSSLAAPMTQLLHLGQKFEWGEAQHNAYTTLRNLMTKEGKVLRPVDPNRELILHTDWSNYGIGAVLGQLDDDGNEYMCACISRSLNKHERNYPSYKGELLALAWAVKMFRHHLHGTHFHLVTDHQPLTWLMKARDLSGQYSRWQMLLQEYDFEITHRPGVKHNNADTLSRFPQASSEDITGARLDVEKIMLAVPATGSDRPLQERYAGRSHDHTCPTCCTGSRVWCRSDAVGLAPTRTTLRPSAIDSFCPRFKDLLGGKSGFVEGHYYMNQAMQGSDMQDLEPSVNDSEQEPLRQLVGVAFREAKAGLREQIPEAVAKAAAHLQSKDDEDSGKLDTGIVAASFYDNAQHHGITLLELCAGLASGIEAVLLSGIKVNAYYYVDRDPVAREIAQFRLANLSAKFPDLFPPTAWEAAFSLPQDLNHLHAHYIERTLCSEPAQILVMAGWPCQDYSPAGRGKVGRRAALLDKVLDVVRHLQRRHWDHPVAYVLENVPVQLNFRHKHIRTDVAQALQEQLGTPVTFDAADVGSYAARIRNYWTNLSSPFVTQLVYDRLKFWHEGDLYDILEPGRHPMPVDHMDHTGRNKPGETRRVWPTLMSFHKSRAFRAGRAGCVYDEHRNLLDEPSILERELAMGYEPSCTAAPGVSQRERSRIIGQAIDLNALFSLFQVAQRLRESGLSHIGAAKREPRMRPIAATMTTRFNSDSGTIHGDRERDAFVAPRHMVAYVGTQPTDVWEDDEVMDFLHFGTLPIDSHGQHRVKRRAKGYRWFNNRLFKVIQDRDNRALTYRMVPRPDDRDQLVLDNHVELGHLGEKRTIAALAYTYWWYGMTVDVKRVLSGCKLCKRVLASGGHQQRDMQTEPTGEYGLFHRWGMDYIVDLPASAKGNRHALVMIDYFSKWVEVIPTTTTDSKITTELFHLYVASRYGVPAEVICDNGASFKDHFSDYCRKRLIHQRFITADVPRSNGLAERAVQTIKKALRKHVAHEHNALTWDTDGLAAILAGYRCTPHSASGHSPARILFAVDPVLDAEQYFSKRGPIDYSNPDEEKIIYQLLERAALAQEIGMDVVHNLRTAHERDARRFKAVRSGLYIPRIHHFHPGDYVFILAQGQKPGGTLGIRARNEVLRVQQVRPSGVLILINQAGQVIEKHMEHCVPCMLPNIVGETYSGLVKPSADLHCEVCKDDRNWDVMILCDNCDSGWHTYCLLPPLDDVPEGDWLCPHCVDNGMTMEKLAQKRASYREDPRSRPDLELPNRSRIAKARRLADEWHGVGVRRSYRGKEFFGRVTFQHILQPKWFRIHWLDGSSSEHMGHIFKHLVKVPEDQLPPGLPPVPEPAVIMATGPVRVSAALQSSMLTPRSHDSVRDTSSVSTAELAALLNVLQCRKPAHEPTQALVAQSLACQQDGPSPAPPTDCVMDPSGLNLTGFLGEDGEVDAILISHNFAILEDLLLRAAQRAKKVICAKVPVAWAHTAENQAIGHWLMTLASEGRLLKQTILLPDDQLHTDLWLYIFPSLEVRHRLFPPETEMTACTGLLYDVASGKSISA
jgi:hypothetical protein